MPTSIQTRDFIDFLQKPSIVSKNGFKHSWLFWMVLVGGAQILAIIVSLIGGLALAGFGFEGQNSVQSAILSYPTWLFFILVAVQAPLSEELAFRLFLKPGYWRWIGSFFGISFYFQQTLPKDLIFLNYGLSLNFDYLLSAFANSVVLSAVLALLWKKWPKFQTKLEIYFSRYFAQCCYLSALLFGVIHIQNYSGLSGLIWLTPLLVLPQTIIGFVITYLRVRMGFKWAVLAHSLYNSLAAMPIFILSFLPAEIFSKLLDRSQATVDVDFLKALTPNQTSLIFFAAVFFALVLSWNLFCLIWLIWSYFRAKAVSFEN